MAEYNIEPLFSIGDKVKIKMPKETCLNLKLYNYETNSRSNIILTEEDTYFIVDIRNKYFDSDIIKYLVSNIPNPLAPEEDSNGKINYHCCGLWIPSKYIKHADIGQVKDKVTELVNKINKGV